MTARAVGSGTISFGLVSIPFKQFTAASSSRVRFNTLHNKCGGRMKQQYFCPIDNCIVERADMVKGFEFAMERYVTFTDTEIRKHQARRTDSLELVAFVPEDTVDLVVLEKSYYVAPDRGGEKAYQLLARAMQRTKRVAVGRFSRRGREQLVILRPYRSRGLIMHHVYYSNEVRAFDELDLGTEHVFRQVEEDLANKLIEELARDTFDARSFKDDYEERIKASIEAKVSGQEIIVAQEPPNAQIIDLFEALKRSLDASAREAPPSAEPKPAKPTIKKGRTNNVVPIGGATTSK